MFIPWLQWRVKPVSFHSRPHSQHGQSGRSIFTWMLKLVRPATYLLILTWTRPKRFLRTCTTKFLLLESLSTKLYHATPTKKLQNQTMHSPTRVSVLNMYALGTSHFGCRRGGIRSFLVNKDAYSLGQTFVTKADSSNRYTHTHPWKNVARQIQYYN